MQLITVFDRSELPQELYEYVCEEQANDSFRKVRLPYKMLRASCQKWDGDIPLDNEAKLAKWCTDHGANVDGPYPYCLISISW